VVGEYTVLMAEKQDYLPWGGARVVSDDAGELAARR
jgi:hypothetical protein